MKNHTKARLSGHEPLGSMQAMAKELSLISVCAWLTLAASECSDLAAAYSQALAKVCPPECPALVMPVPGSRDPLHQGPAGAQQHKWGWGPEGSSAAPRHRRYRANGAYRPPPGQPWTVQHAQRPDGGDVQGDDVTGVHASRWGQGDPSNTVTRRQTPQPGGLQAPLRRCTLRPRDLSGTALNPY